MKLKAERVSLKSSGPVQRRDWLGKPAVLSPGGFFLFPAVASQVE
jgi:hypothetical protein